MTGGFLQLAATSTADSFLTSNPQISFFKNVFRKHTRFAIESIDETGTNTELKKTSNSTFRIKIPRDGDLICGMYFVFTLPTIYSGKFSNDNSNTYNFKWVRNIAAHIIKNVTLFIGSQKIDTLTGEWIDIQNELRASYDQKVLGAKLSGNVKEFYEPENALGNNGNYPHIRGDNNAQHARNDALGFNSLTINDVIEGTTFPSIAGTTLKIPLPFFFSGNPGLSIPLISLQYHEVELEFTLAPLYDLFTVIDPVGGRDSFGKRVKVTDSLDNELGFANFTKDPTFLSSGRLNINAKIETLYAFLDTEERKRFASFEHEYLITQVNKQSPIIGVDTPNQSFKISGLNPVKYIVVAPKREDQIALNQHGNFTHWINGIPPYSPEFKFSDQYYDTNKGIFPFYTNDYIPQTDLTPGNSKRDIIESMVLKLNGSERFSQRQKEYFLYQQPLQHFNVAPTLNGIYCYSFSLSANEYQPTGSCDFSVFNEVHMEINSSIPSITNYTYKVNYDIYIVNYNILKVVSGMGSLVYAY